MTTLFEASPAEPDTRVASLPVKNVGSAYLMRPGFTERTLVVITVFVILNGLPNTWFRRPGSGLEGNPLLVAVELGLIGLAVLRIAGSFELVFRTLRLEPAISLLVGLALASTFWSANLYLTMKDSVILGAVTLYAVYLLMRFALNEILGLFSHAFAAGTALNLVFVLGLPQYAQAGGNWNGVYSQKNALGFAAVVTIPILLTAARDSRRFRLFFVAAAIGQFGLLLGSQSKTMLVATVSTIALMLVYRGFRARKTLRGAVIVGLGSTSLFTVAFATANISLLARWLEKDVTLTGRTVLWDNLWPVFLERPLLGFGYSAAFDGYFSPIHEVWIQNRWNPTHAHNALLHTGLELGVIGVLVTLFIFGRALGRAVTAVRDVPGAVGIWPLAFLSTSVLISITESGVLSNNTAWLLYVLSVLVVASHHQETKHRVVDRTAVSDSPNAPSGIQ